MKKICLLMLAFALLLGIAGPAATQSATTTGDNSVYFVSYFSNNVAAAPDATVRFINDGDTGGNLWAAFYVFDDSQELTECCACQITPDGLLSEDVVPTAGLRGFATHIQAVKSTTYAITETKFADANLGGAEETLLQNLCYYDSLLSGLPCTCTPEDHDF